MMDKLKLSRTCTIV